MSADFFEFDFSEKLEKFVEIEKVHVDVSIIGFFFFFFIIKKREGNLIICQTHPR